MKSLDPWRVILTNPSGEVIVPSPSYGHQLYREVPSWIHYGNGNGNGTHRLLFDGAFIGAEAPPSPSPTGERRTGLTAAVAPIVAPATGGISVRKELDDKQVLHVEICVDGKCYRTSMDLAPAIALIMGKLARWHEGQHEDMHASAQVPPTVVVGAVDAAVGEAVDAIVGELIGSHVDTICGSFLGDIAGAVKSAATGLTGGVIATFKKLKGPIGVAAGIAAVSGAMLIPGVGPIAAPIAGKLAHDLVQSAAGDKSAKKSVAQANQEAKTNPVIAVALDQAQKAVANATVAHHVQDTAKKAARGQPAAQQQIIKVAEDAEKGDPAAKAVADLVANAMHSEWGSKLWEKATGRGPATVSGYPWYDVVGASPLDAVRDRGKALASAKPGAAAGTIHSSMDGFWHTYMFVSLDAAIDWLQRVTTDRSSFTYAAAYEKAADGIAYIQAEEIGSVRHAPQPGQSIPRDVATSSGW